MNEKDKAINPEVAPKSADKKPYTAPKVTVHGAVEKITEGPSGGTQKETGFTLRS